MERQLDKLHIRSQLQEPTLSAARKTLKKCSWFFLSSAMACGFGQPVVAQTEAYLASPDELVCGVPDLLLGGRDAEWNVESTYGVDLSASFATITVGAAGPPGGAATGGRARAPGPARGAGRAGLR